MRRLKILVGNVVRRIGKWVRNKNATPRNPNRVRKTHTSPVQFGTYDGLDDGHADPSRIRHAATKAYHRANR